MQRFLVGAILLLTLLAGCSSSSAPTSTAPGETPTTTAVSTPGQAVTYTCPMHPEVLSDKPGKCPKCGMELVLKK